jgi:pimeloyl-ACP methyl ester carboxylesterase
MQQKTITYKGKTLAYNLAGSGRVVVLVHGFGEDGFIWQQQVKILQKAFTVVVPHLPGSGASHLQEDMRMEGLADSVAAILKAEAIAECAMIGHSMGGYVTLAFAQNHKRVLKGFGLFHSTAFADSDAKKATRQKGIDFIKQHGAYAFLKTTIPNLYSPATKQSAPALIEEHVALVSYFTDAALINYYQAMMARWDRTATLKETDLPVLFVLGGHDAAVPPEEGWKQAHVPQKSYIHMLNNAGHMGMREEVEKTNTLLTEYLHQTL